MVDTEARPCSGQAYPVLDQCAYQLGRELGDTARSAVGNPDTRQTVLADVTLANCPFHILAQEYTELVCGMNLRLIEGLLDGLAPTGLTAHLDPAPPRCCLRLIVALV